MSSTASHLWQWRAASILGEGDTLPLPSIGIEIPLAELYEGLAFPAPPL